ncbi:MAG: hypothetical protein R6X10_15385 [Desulfobacterales bacterium]
MISDKKKFFMGAGLLLSFFVVFAIIFSPVFDGKNGLEFLDNLYNSISKGSAYYIPDLKDSSAAHNGKTVTVNLALKDADDAKQTSLLFLAAGATVDIHDSELKVSGDFGKILENCLDDADQMYLNQGEKLSDKYGYDEKKVLYNWWTAASLMDKDLKEQRLFKEAEVVTTVKNRAVETAYNYYKIEPQKISERLGIVIFSLIFYVVYTLWYGFAIMYMFDGWGLKLEH